MHPAPTKADQQEADRESTLARAAATLAAHLLPLWRPARERFGGKLLRPPPEQRRRRQRERGEDGHVWHYSPAAGQWCCEGCGLATANRSAQAKCGGRNRHLADIIADRKGHELIALAHQSRVCLLCSACGAWTYCGASGLSRWRPGVCGERGRQNVRQVVEHDRHPCRRARWAGQLDWWQSLAQGEN